jgi:hypothetical protein
LVWAELRYFSTYFNLFLPNRLFGERETKITFCAVSLEDVYFKPQGWPFLYLPFSHKTDVRENLALEM